MISVCRLTGLRGPVVVECVGVDDEYDANELGLVHLGALYRRECHRDPDSPETRDLKARLRAAIEAQQRSGGSVTRGAHTSCPADAFEPIPG